MPTSAAGGGRYRAFAAKPLNTYTAGERKGFRRHRRDQHLRGDADSQGVASELIVRSLGHYFASISVPHSLHLPVTLPLRLYPHCWQ